MPAIERGLAKAGGRSVVVRDLGSAVRRHRARPTRSSRRARKGDAAADRVLRFDARVPRCARAARLGRSPDRAQRAVEAGRVGRDGRPDRRRDPAARSRSSPSPEGVGAELKRALRRRRRPVLVLRAVRDRPRAVGAGDRRPQAGVASAPRYRDANRSIDATVASGSSCGPKWPSAGHHLERAVREPFRDLRRRTPGEMSVDRLAAHDAHRRTRPRASSANAPWFGPIE